MLEELKCRKCLKIIKADTTEFAYIGDIGYNNQDVIIIQCPYCDRIDFYLEH